MYPSEWKQWSSIEKATYVAQIATAAAFLGSSIFSFLSWREAKGARDDQRTFFISEKRPVLKLSRDEKYVDHEGKFNLRVILVNQGLSSAKNVRMHLSGAQAKLGNNSYFQMGEDFDCQPETVEKEDFLYCSIATAEKTQKPLSAPSSDVKVYSDYSLISKDYKSKNSLIVYYEGLFNDKHELPLWIEVK